MITRTGHWGPLKPMPSPSGTGNPKLWDYNMQAEAWMCVCGGWGGGGDFFPVSYTRCL